MRHKRKNKCNISSCQLAAISLHHHHNFDGGGIDDGGGGLNDVTDGVNQGENFTMEMTILREINFELLFLRCERPLILCFYHASIRFSFLVSLIATLASPILKTNQSAATMVNPLLDLIAVSASRSTAFLLPQYNTQHRRGRIYHV